jgi:hypothetical protein
LAVTNGTDITTDDKVKVIQNHKTSIKMDLKNLGVTM